MISHTHACTHTLEWVVTEQINEHSHTHIHTYTHIYTHIHTHTLEQFVTEQVNDHTHTNPWLKRKNTYNATSLKTKPGLLQCMETARPCCHFPFCCCLATLQTLKDPSSEPSLTQGKYHSLIFFNINLLIFWLHWVFVAVCGLSLSYGQQGLLPSCGVQLSHRGSFSCGSQAPSTQAHSLGTWTPQL